MEFCIYVYRKIPGAGGVMVDSQLFGATSEWIKTAICDGSHGNAPGDGLRFKLSETEELLFLPVKEEIPTWLPPRKLSPALNTATSESSAMTCPNPSESASTEP